MIEPDWIKDKHGRYICNAENPMPPDLKLFRWVHTQVTEIGDGEYTMTIKCLNCGHTWREEIPE